MECGRGEGGWKRRGGRGRCLSGAGGIFVGGWGGGEEGSLVALGESDGGLRGWVDGLGLRVSWDVVLIIEWVVGSDGLLDNRLGISERDAS